MSASADRLPLVAVLCASERARPAASGVALALARALRRPAAVAGGVGVEAAAALGATPAARRAAGRLRGRGLPACANGRLVCLADGRDALVDPVAAEATTGHGAVRAAAASAELARAATAVALPGAVALPFTRTAALDRVLAWHDAIVAVPQPGASEAMVAESLASLAALGRPVAAMAPPSRVGAALACGGLRAPAEAIEAVAALGLDASGRDG
ncbi:MAG TPA: hypothetical protein VFU94_13920 [Conexibacter sp.]|nr:hypothetical protein [Conexibacter sp.]